MIFGRDSELETILTLLEPGGPRLVCLHGMAGIGKSTLLSRFHSEAKAHNCHVVVLDGRLIEPTERGFLNAVSAAIKGEKRLPKLVARRISELSKTVILSLNNYEVLQLLDTWLTS